MNFLDTLLEIRLNETGTLPTTIRMHMATFASYRRMIDDLREPEMPRFPFLSAAVVVDNAVAPGEVVFEGAQKP